MRCDFAERYLYLLCCFLHMRCIFAGEWCSCSPYTRHPFFHTFIIIADLYRRIVMFFCPLHRIHRTKHLSCNIPDLYAFRITAASGFSEFFSVRCQDHTAKGISSDTFFKASIHIGNHHIFRHFHNSCCLFFFIPGHILRC